MWLNNALSPFGKTWLTNNLIEEYQLIKNIPPDFLDGLNPKNYFPKINFD